MKSGGRRPEVARAEYERLGSETVRLGPRRSLGRLSRGLIDSRLKRPRIPVRGLARDLHGQYISNVLSISNYEDVTLCFEVFPLSTDPHGSASEAPGSLTGELGDLEVPRATEGR